MAQPLLQRAVRGDAQVREPSVQPEPVSASLAPAVFGDWLRGLIREEERFPATFSGVAMRMDARVFPVKVSE
ncbi:hypothetical protein CapIbe_011407 [Capra ibex]